MISLHQCVSKESDVIHVEAELEIIKSRFIDLTGIKMQIGCDVSKVSCL